MAVPSYRYWSAMGVRLHRILQHSHRIIKPHQSSSAIRLAVPDQDFAFLLRSPISHPHNYESEPQSCRANSTHQLFVSHSDLGRIPIPVYDIIRCLHPGSSVILLCASSAGGMASKAIDTGRQGQPSFVRLQQ